ncbi:MAG: Uma2 family endonuclease [Microscillaceae bacterium]|jgi:Uma2 family endonuclease|nr:Uma2 family endonuclease [Microscillaceae bacterium]
METTIEKTPKQPKISKALIFEVLDGKPLYRKDYQAVSKGTKILEDIMGSSLWQSILISLISEFLMRNLDKSYMVLGNELGVHLNKNNNLSADIAIFKRADLKNKSLLQQYATIAPEVVIEVDIKIEENQIKGMDYFQVKTQKLLDFGVKKVLWFTSAQQKVMEASPNQTWTIDNWDKTIEVLGVQFSLAQLLAEEGFDLSDNL